MERMAGGYMNRFLRVNLTDGKFTEEEPSEDLIKDYIGGRGFAVKILFDELKPGVDPLGPENKSIIATGPLCGTHCHAFGRWIVAAKSPLTNTFFRSVGGGAFGAGLKSAGLDLIIIEGKAKKPVYLWLHGGKYEIRDAKNLIGLNTDAAQERMKQEIGDPKAKTACTGPAADKLVKYAAIISDRRAAARGGMGTVWASKNLKGIAVSGNKEVPVAMPERFEAAVGLHTVLIKRSEPAARFSVTGTQAAEFTNVPGLFPTKNFREGFLPNFMKIAGDEYTKLRLKKTACHRCMIHCGSIVRSPKGSKYPDVETEGPEYETIWAFTGPILCDDISFTIEADKMCDDLGLDTISVGSSIGFAYELFEKGIITTKDTGGIALKYGDTEPAHKLIIMIANREGIGDILAEGTRRAAQIIGKGSEEYAMQVKGLELPGYDPRGAKAHGLSMVTSNIGGSHNLGYSPQELFNVPLPRPVDRGATEGKGRLARLNQDSTAVVETAISCVFPLNFFTMTVGTLNKLLGSVTGVKEHFDPANLWKTGERIYNLERMFNVRDGIAGEYDTLPERIVKEPLPAGGSAGWIFELETMLKDYYEARGWDPDTGIPTKKKLEELGLGFTVK